jgi:hypothetical protein
VAISIDIFDGPEFRFLCIRFSSGFTLKELCSIATVVCEIGRIPPPPRSAKRAFHGMLAWFIENWAGLAPFLPLVGLADGEGRPIDGRREILEKGLRELSI